MANALMQKAYAYGHSTLHMSHLCQAREIFMHKSATLRRHIPFASPKGKMILRGVPVQGFT